jgi:hypothetical protein
MLRAWGRRSRGDTLTIELVRRDRAGLAQHLLAHDGLQVGDVYDGAEAVRVKAIRLAEPAPVYLFETQAVIFIESAYCVDSALNGPWPVLLAQLAIVARIHTHDLLPDAEHLRLRLPTRSPEPRLMLAEPIDRPPDAVTGCGLLWFMDDRLRRLLRAAEVQDALGGFGDAVVGGRLPAVRPLLRQQEFGDAPQALNYRQAADNAALVAHDSHHAITATHRPNVGTTHHSALTWRASLGGASSRQQAASLARSMYFVCTDPSPIEWRIVPRVGLSGAPTSPMACCPVAIRR